MVADPQLERVAQLAPQGEFWLKGKPSKQSMKKLTRRLQQMNATCNVRKNRRKHRQDLIAERDVKLRDEALQPGRQHICNSWQIMCRCTKSGMQAIFG